LLSPLGIGTDESWQAIREGRNGISHIEQFDAAAFACRIAGEVKNFDPTRFIERKEIKKMGRFIQFGIAASGFAMAQSGLKVDSQNAERVGVVIGSGIGGFEVIEREHRILLEKGPSRISPFFIPATTWRPVTFPFALARRDRIQPPPPHAPPAPTRLAIHSRSFSATRPTS
jgi:3-oxoacyl-[acyl-carrier-protein] synthase II